MSDEFELLLPAPGVDLAQTIATFGTPPSVFGVEKDQSDLLRYEEIIRATKPEVLVETGTRRGYSAKWFSGLVAKVITIDVNPRLAIAPQQLRVIRLVGSSTEVEVYQDVCRLTKGRRTMVSLDSDHSFNHVLAEIGLYTPLVSPGCYLVVEDGIYHFHNSHEYDGDPLQAISCFLPEEATFVRDEEIEGRYPTTGNIAGFWRRVADQ